MKPLLITLWATLITATLHANQIMYVASITDKTIVSFELDQDTGKLQQLQSTTLPISPGPLCFSPSGEYLYAAMSGKNDRGLTVNGIASLKVRPEGRLELIAYAKIEVRTPYLRISPCGNFALTAHYSTGEINVYQITDNLVTSTNLDHHDTERTAHCIEFDRSGKYVYVPHTAPNKVYQYKFDSSTGKLTHLKTPWVMGPDEEHQYHQPRHIAFHPILDMAYTSNERGGGISGYHLNVRTGQLTRKQTLSSLPKGYTGSSAAADIKITPNGKFVFISNRDSEKREQHADSIAAFAIDNRGELTRVGTYPTVWFPRSISIDRTGTFLIAAGQRSGTMAAYRINPTTGSLTHLKTYDVGDGTIWTTWK